VRGGRDGRGEGQGGGGTGGGREDGEKEGGREEENYGKEEGIKGIEKWRGREE